MKKLVISIIILFVSLAFLGTSVFLFFMSPVSKSDETVTFLAAEGGSTRSLLKGLEDEGLIRSDFCALLYMKIKPSFNIKAGTYNISKNLSTKEILKLLNEGHTIEKQGKKVTFIEGKRLSDYVKVISKSFGYEEDEILDQLNDPKYIDELINQYWFITDEIKNDNIYYPLEGYLYPDTYLFEIDASITQIVNKLIDTTAIRLAPYKDLIQESKYSFHEILSLASDVELEGSKESDRKLIAGVFLNRLNIGMALGSDVTTYYAAKIEMGEELHIKHINLNNPYNTRGPNMNGKINVGPICSPGITSIVAVLEPTENDYLYFYADWKNDGTVYYSKTYSEHVKTVNKFE